jgi:opacity protein-like surface antigen
MHFRFLALGALVLVWGSADPAGAADLFARRGLERGYVPAPVTSHTAWYVRGDIGYAIQDEPDITEAAGLYDLDSPSLDNTWTFGLGIGRYFASNFRGDITWDYRRESDVRGFTLEAPFAGDRRFGLSSNVILANLYYDFKRGGHVTPYIGAGIGAVHHRTSRGEVVPTPCGCAGDIESSSNWSVAAAFMAGVTINFGSQTTYGGSIKDAPVTIDTRGRWNLDAGYRFLYLGEARTGSIAASSGWGPVIDGDKVKDITAHELRLGLRYDLH